MAKQVGEGIYGIKSTENKENHFNEEILLSM
jgi:hypothetical protein